MHYNTDYAHLEGAEKLEAAIQDIREYYGEERFLKIEATMLEHLRKNPDYQLFSAMLHLSGIQGYPAYAWHTVLLDRIKNPE